MLAELERGLALVTVRCSCDYVAELLAFDRVLVQMRLGNCTQNRITLLFEYWRQQDPSAELIARGEQQVACMRREGEKMVPTPIPAPLQAALKQYMD